MWYNIDFNKLTVFLTPIPLRRIRFVSFICLLLTTLKDSHSTFLSNRADRLDKIKNTGQVCYLRGVLNDKFDIEYRRIRISSSLRKDAIYIFTPVEDKPLYLGTKYLFPRTFYSGGAVDFMVEVPAEIAQTQYHEIVALINFYKEGVKTFEIVET